MALRKCAEVHFRDAMAIEEMWWLILDVRWFICRRGGLLRGVMALRAARTYFIVLFGTFTEMRWPL